MLSASCAEELWVLSLIYAILSCGGGGPGALQPLSLRQESSIYCVFLWLKWKLELALSVCDLRRDVKKQLNSMYILFNPFFCVKAFVFVSLHYL